MGRIGPVTRAQHRPSTSAAVAAAEALARRERNEETEETEEEDDDGEEEEEEEEGQLQYGDDKEPHFSVERILSKRIEKDGTPKFLLKWRNFPLEQSTWEPLNNLDCTELVLKFEKKLAKREAELVPIRIFKTLYNASALSQFIAGYQMTYPDLSTINMLDNPSDSVLQYLEPERVLGFSRNSPEVYFVVKFAHREEPILVHNNVMYHQWAELASVFWNQWYNQRYQSTYDH